MRRLGAGATRFIAVRKRGTVILLVVMFISVIAAAIAHVALRMAVIRDGYAISEESRERQLLEEENRKLRLEHSLLRSPERVERLATEKLGMTRPDPAQIRVVRHGGRAPLARK